MTAGKTRTLRIGSWLVFFVLALFVIFLLFASEIKAGSAGIL